MTIICRGQVRSLRCNMSWLPLSKYLAIFGFGSAVFLCQRGSFCIRGKRLSDLKHPSLPVDTLGRHRLGRTLPLSPSNQSCASKNEFTVERPYDVSSTLGLYGGWARFLDLLRRASWGLFFVEGSDWPPTMHPLRRPTSSSIKLTRIV